LRELAPQATTIGFFLNPAYLGSASQLSDMQEAVRTLNLQVHILQASTDREIESASGAVAAQGIQALAVAGDRATGAHDSGRSVMANKDIIIGRVINITGMIGVLAGTVLFSLSRLY
jgi:putative ABC transport system substrate-binding protein